VIEVPAQNAEEAWGGGVSKPVWNWWMKFAPAVKWNPILSLSSELRFNAKNVEVKKEENQERSSRHGTNAVGETSEYKIVDF
jgi:hypothetical protein